MAIPCSRIVLHLTPSRFAAVQAEALQNYQLYVAVADRGPLRDPDEFYAQDLIGCRVVDQVGARVAAIG